jgi:hypothetical protein
MDPARNAGDRRSKSFNFGAIAHYVGFVFVGEISWGYAPGFMLTPAPQAPD